MCEAGLQNSLRSPFPFFGGKSRAAALIWSRFGDVRNYVEPFFGSGAVLLGRPQPINGVETVNDRDGFIANFWRALQHEPDAVARWADNPVNECDLHARHIWLVERSETLTRRLEGDPDYYDPKIAGYWVWGISCWIGKGWCSGRGPWRAVTDEDGSKLLVQDTDDVRGIMRKLPHLMNAGKGIHRARLHLGSGQGIISRQRTLTEYFGALAARLRYVRVTCGDWRRVLGPSVTTQQGPTAILLDPPYSAEAKRDSRIYATDSLEIAHEVREWAIANGSNPLLRIALCGYEREHQFHMPDSWECVVWRPHAGYDAQAKDKTRIGANRAQERIWFSPHCNKWGLLFAQENQEEQKYANYS